MKKKSLSGLVLMLFLSVVTVIFFIPLYIALVSVFKTSEEILRTPFSLPLKPTLDNIIYVFTSTNFNIFEMYFNSITITCFAIVAGIIISSMAAYYVSRSATRISKIIYIYYLIGLMVPYVIVYVPLAVILKILNISINLFVLMLTFTSGTVPISVFLYVGYIKSIPNELEEAAVIDGAGQMRLFWEIIFPLLKPCTATVAIFLGLGCWNDFLTPLVLGQIKTITVGIYSAIGPYSADWGTVFSFVLFASAPIIILFLLMQKQFINGLTSGAVKG